MAEPTIYVIPAEYYGGAVPKGREKEPQREAAARIGAPPGRRFRLSARAGFFIAVGVLFAAVVGAAAWYFTAPLRAPATAPIALAVLPMPEPEASMPEPAPKPPSRPAAPDTSAIPAAAPIPTPPSPPPDLSKDTDRDGLSDAEEAIYRSEITIPDTDRDGFLDGHEVFHLYNPSGNAPERLLDAGLAGEYVNDAYAYSVFIPRGFSAAPSVENPAEVRVQSGEEVVFLIAVSRREKGISLTQWVRNQAGESPTQLLPWNSNKAGLEATVVGDSGAGWVAQAGQETVIQLRFAADDARARKTYKTTFEMMLNSLIIRE